MKQETRRQIGMVIAIVISVSIGSIWTRVLFYSQVSTTFVTDTIYLPTPKAKKVSRHLTPLGDSLVCFIIPQGDVAP
jgi:hypothetical protein